MISMSSVSPCIQLCPIRMGMPDDQLGVVDEDELVDEILPETIIKSRKNIYEIIKML